MFTPEQQKEHRLALARHLSRNVKDSAYDHTSFATCALGHAGKIGIGGMRLSQEGGCDGLPVLSLPILDVNPDMPPFDVADTVFGVGSWTDIFSYHSKHDDSRKGVIKVLREF